MDEYGQPVAMNKRVRFFDGQYLVDQDFIDEQRYHLDRERRLGRALRITGIAEGLEVSSDRANTVTVTAGTAIDAGGRQLVLAEDRTLNLPGPMFNDKQQITLHLVYREQATDLATTGFLSERRWDEDPLVAATTADGQGTATWPAGTPTVVLAQLRLDNQGTVTVDRSVAQPAGIRVPGSVGIGAASPVAKLDIAAPESTSAPALHLRNGNSAGAFDRSQLTLGGGTQYRHAIKSRHNSVEKVGNAIDFFLWNHGVDTADTIGTQHVMTLNPTGVGIGTHTPRTALDTGTGVMSGAANDYIKAQFMLSGGGTVTWEGPGGRLKWTKRFIAISMARGSTFASGYVNISQPTTPIPSTNVYDGQERAADENGVPLNNWEALYAVHRVGGRHHHLEGLFIRHYDQLQPFHTPSNWILVAVVNGEDDSVKLGTGMILGPRSSSVNGSLVPTGTIVMWSGTVTSIPYGWALCDGQNRTPDLRSRFVVGAHPGTEHEPGKIGDADKHSHTVDPPSGSYSTDLTGLHNHAPPPQWYDRNFLQSLTHEFHGIDRGSPSVHHEAVRTSSDGSHKHSVSVDLPSFSSGSYTGANRPRWYAICFIMKL